MCVRLFCSLFIINEVYGKSTVQKDIVDYFNDDTVRAFTDKWELHRAPIENAISMALQETFGRAGLNPQLVNEAEALKISDGFLVDDKMVKVLFRDMYLSRLPHLKDPRVVFALPSNVFQVEASVSKMFVETKYQLFRNISDVVYADKGAASAISPFTMQQVQNMGQATIIAEHCNLAGFALAKLQGESVHLGQDHFKLNKCKFSIEISTPKFESPPLIAPYFAKELGFQLENVILKPIQLELMTKLQHSILSYVNTSSTLGNLLPSLRNLQQKLFKETSEYTTNIIKNLNKLTAEENAASEELDDLNIPWTDEYNGIQQTYSASLINMTLSGLDTAYSAHTGGPYKLVFPKLDDAIRFNTLQVRGFGVIKVNEERNSFMFSSEIKDFISLVTFRMQHIKNNENYLQLPQDILKLETRGWRSLEINGPKSPHVNMYSLITGFLINQIPEILMKHLSLNFYKAVEIISKETVNAPVNQDDLDVHSESQENQLTTILDVIEENTSINEKTKPETALDQNSNEINEKEQLADIFINSEDQSGYEDNSTTVVADASQVEENSDNEKDESNNSEEFDNAFNNSQYQDGNEENITADVTVASQVEYDTDNNSIDPNNTGLDQLTNNSLNEDVNKEDITSANTEQDNQNVSEETELQTTTRKHRIRATTLDPFYG